MKINSIRKPTFFESVVPFIAMSLFLGIGYSFLKLRIEVLLISAAAVAAFIGLRIGYTWKELENGIFDAIRKGLPAILIVITVGALIGSWIASGTIPMLIYYGLKIISPQFYLFTACLVSSLIALVTGTSYGTIGTIGVAFIGIAHGLNIPLGQAGGALISGAYFGDKISPFSDTTNLAPIAAQSNLYDHIKHMLWTTSPAMLIGLTVYFLLGIFSHSQGNLSLEKAELFSSVIEANYKFSILLLLPPIITLYLAVKQKPILPGMFLSTAVAVILGIFLQNESLKSSIDIIVMGYKANTQNAMVDMLLSRGGMRSMMTITLITFSAFSFGGIMRQTRMLEVILEHLLKIANTVGKLIAASVVGSISTALLTGSAFLSILIPGELFAPAYKKFNLAAKNLSRTTEDSGTVIVPLIPWASAGVFMSGTLGVSTLDYAPWAFMNYLGFIFAIIYGFTGFAIAPKINDDETVTGS